MIKIAWAIWGVVSVAGITVLGNALPAPAGSDRVNEWSKAFLPGETTHGHYQIELKCQACHDQFGGVRDESCNECHGDALKASRDTHPKSKFDDPSNAHLLSVIDARSCIACHEEHSEDRTHAMGVSVQSDYCWQCHQDVGDQRPSHVGMAFDSCASAGCHNFHDNQALYENFLVKHASEPQTLDSPRVPARKSVTAGPKSLTKADHDGPVDSDPVHIDAWSGSQHALAGVNCTGCHRPDEASETALSWSNQVSTETCAHCHEENVDGFHDGLHGMRPGSGLTAMTPERARLPMKRNAVDKMLDCNSCHSPHTANTKLAAAESCLSCHNDSHSVAYEATVHASLWNDELAEVGDANTGVSCATCHLPRDENGRVEHNQNANLQPNEKMIRSVCMNCHGLEFAIDALADKALVDSCFNGQPTTHIESVEMASSWFAERERQRQERLRKREQQRSPN